MTHRIRLMNDEVGKLYWKIGEVAEMYDVETSLLRFWESEFEELHPRKNRRGQRQFVPEDIKMVDRIYYLVKVRLFTLAGARQELSKIPSR